MINGITTDSQTFYIRVNLSIVPSKAHIWFQQRGGPQIGTPFKDGIQLTIG